MCEEPAKPALGQPRLDGLSSLYNDAPPCYFTQCAPSASAPNQLCFSDALFDFRSVYVLPTMMIGSHVGIAARWSSAADPMLSTVLSVRAMAYKAITKIMGDEYVFATSPSPWPHYDTRI